MDRVKEGDIALPSVPDQVTNAIRFIGDEVTKTGQDLSELPKGFYAIIGAPDPGRAVRLLKELVEKRLIAADDALRGVNLTLDGWEHYEAEKHGQVEGDYGFVAMQFNDCALDPFVKNVVKPAVKEAIGYDLVDMRDVGQAGVIDNLMRMQIRNAKFVLVDLTHDNNGAYWEGGYAEGLGKPVIYICEREKFEGRRPEQGGTHFDTNHCTTIPWSIGDEEGFRNELTATLRRSLDL